MALAQSTLKLYKSTLKNHLMPFCKQAGIKKLDNSFQNHVDEYVAYLKRKKLSGNTIRQYLTISKFVFTYHGYGYNFTYRIPREEKQAQDRKYQARWFSDDEIALCKTYTFPFKHVRNHLILRLLCETGVRINELANVRVCNVYPDRKTIKIEESKTIPRDVTFSPETQIFLKKYLEKEFADHPLNSRALLFPGKNQIYKIIIRMLEDLSLKKPKDGRGPHTFRHYVATTLHYTRRLDVKLIADFLGDKPDTISSRYLHSDGEILNDIISKASGW